MKSSKLIVHELMLEVVEIKLINPQSASVWFRVSLDAQIKDETRPNFLFFSVDIPNTEILNFRSTYEKILHSLSDCLVDFGVLIPKSTREQAVKNIVLNSYGRQKISDFVLSCEITGYNEKLGLLNYQLTFANFFQMGCYDIFSEFEKIYALADYFEFLDIEADIIEAISQECNNKPKNDNI